MMPHRAGGRHGATQVDTKVLAMNYSRTDAEAPAMDQCGDSRESCGCQILESNPVMSSKTDQNFKKIERFSLR
jgi:hypothetical protein